MSSSSFFDTLESRTLFAAQVPTPEETYLVELINRARANPIAEAISNGIDLNEGLAAGAISTTAKQPLSINQFLTESANIQADFIRRFGQITFVGPNGTVPIDRINASGYTVSGNGGTGESVSAIIGTAVTNSQATIDQIARNLFVDNGIDGRVNRVNLLASGFQEIGPGLEFGAFNTGNGTSPPPGTGQQAAAVTTDFASSTGNSGGDEFLVGVAYDDANANSFYDIGEGLANITITARRLTDNVTFTTTTYPSPQTGKFDGSGAASGAYSLRLPAGTYDVIATGSGLANGSVRYPAVVIGSNRNVKRDFTTQQATDTVPNPGGGTAPTTPNPVTLLGDLKGKVYIDKNGNGRRDKDADVSVLAGTRVYVDFDKDNFRDGLEPFGVVQANGTYQITGISPGIYQVTVDIPTGYRVSVPSNTFRTVKVTSGRLRDVKPLLITQRTLIAGSVYRDDNANGIFDTTIEKGRRNSRVYIDLNNDGVWQRGTEPSQKTDGQGKYGFRDLAASTYTVRLIPQVGYLQTQPSNNGFYVVQLPSDGLSILNRNFGLKLLG